MANPIDSRTAHVNETILAGDVFDLGIRRVRVSAMQDGVTVCRDHRGRIAVRNVETNRLSYVPEWRLSGNPKVSSGNQQRSGLRGDPGVPRTASADTREKILSLEADVLRLGAEIARLTKEIEVNRGVF